MVKLWYIHIKEYVQSSMCIGIERYPGSMVK